jgi:type III restriction enzyme
MVLLAYERDLTHRQLKAWSQNLGHESVLTSLGSYAMRGWRRGNVFPDFVFASLREGFDQRIVAVESKGDQLAGNLDTEYKRSLLDTLTAGYDWSKPGDLLGRTNVDFEAAVVLFSEIRARLPGLIRGT